MDSQQPSSGQRHPRQHRRRGVLVVLMAAALLVVMGIVALVLDRLWLAAVQTELHSAADAAALAAAGELFADRWNAEDPEHAVRRQTAAALAAGRIAATNRAAGRPVLIDPRRDVRVGRRQVKEETADWSFIETHDHPNAVRVQIERTRDRHNPVALWLRGLSPSAYGDVRVQALAVADNHVVGLRARKSLPVPALPFALRWDDAEAAKEPVSDRYAWVEERQQLVPARDGQPERSFDIGLHEESRRRLKVVHVHGDLSQGELLRQAHTGWTADDLQERGGELKLFPEPLWLPAEEPASAAWISALQQVIGQKRIVLIQDEQATAEDRHGKVCCARAAVVRVMAVEPLGAGRARLVVQPARLCSRAVILASEQPHLADRCPPNPDLFKLQLIH